MDKTDNGKRKSERRSRVLYEITALVVALMIASGVVIFLFVNSSYRDMVRKSVDKVVDEKAQVIDSGSWYMAETEAEIMLRDMSQYSLQELIEMMKAALESGQEFEMFTRVTERMKQLVREGALGVEVRFVVAKAMPPVILEDTVILSSDDRLFRKDASGKKEYWVPEALLSAIEKMKAGGKTYTYLEGGIPEIGFTEEYLLTLYDMSHLNPMLSGMYAGNLVPMHEAVVDIRNYYNNEKNRAMMWIALVVGISVALAVLITFFVLRVLIRREITAPIDELSAAAERVMEGDLDVEINIREGEEFEGLKRAFKEMVESFRKYIMRSVGEE